MWYFGISVVTVYRKKITEYVYCNYNDCVHEMQRIETLWFQMTERWDKKILQCKWRVAGNNRTVLYRVSRFWLFHQVQLSLHLQPTGNLLWMSSELCQQFAESCELVWRPADNEHISYRLHQAVAYKFLMLVYLVHTMGWEEYKDIRITTLRWAPFEKLREGEGRKVILFRINNMKMTVKGVVISFHMLKLMGGKCIFWSTTWIASGNQCGRDMSTQKYHTINHCGKSLCSIITTAHIHYSSERQDHKYGN